MITISFEPITVWYIFLALFMFGAMLTDENDCFTRDIALALAGVAFFIEMLKMNGVIL